MAALLVGGGPPVAVAVAPGVSVGRGVGLPEDGGVGGGVAVAAISASVAALPERELVGPGVGNTLFCASALTMPHLPRMPLSSPHHAVTGERMTFPPEGTVGATK